VVAVNRCDDCGTGFGEIQRSEALGRCLCARCHGRATAKSQASPPSSDGPSANGRRETPTPAELLDATRTFARRFLVLPGEHEETTFALWVAHTHAIDGAHATPYLLILSPEKRSGKTRVQEVKELVVARPWRVTGASEAAIFRKLAADRPTLLLDEIDAIFGTFSERTEPLRAILNAGNRPGAAVARCIGEKGDQVRDFPVFGAKSLAGIDKGERIPDTIRDRSITILMRRKTGAEPVERLRWRTAQAEAAPLRKLLERWGKASSEALLAAEPAIPPSLTTELLRHGSPCSLSLSLPATPGRAAPETPPSLSARTPKTSNPWALCCSARFALPSAPTIESQPLSCSSG
jgi:hypothetical protein